MKTLALEVRDRATFIPVLAVQMIPGNEQQRYLLRRSGYGTDPVCILLTRLDGGEAKYDCYDWPSSTRTMREAHNYIEKNFNELNDGDVIDVEFILGGSTEKKVSEKFL